MSSAVFTDKSNQFLTTLSSSSSYRHLLLNEDFLRGALIKLVLGNAYEYPSVASHFPQMSVHPACCMCFNLNVVLNVLVYSTII